MHAANFHNSGYNTEHNTLVEGTLADFNAAKFIFNLNRENIYASLIDTLTQFVFDNVLDLEEDQFEFKYDSLIRLFNSFLKLEDTHANFFQGKALRNVHFKLYTSLHRRYYYLFGWIIDNVDTNVYEGVDCWNNMTGEMKYEAILILHEAIKDNNIKVIKYLLQTIHVNVDVRHPVTMNTPLHCAILHKVNDEVVACVLEQNPPIFSIENRKDLLPIELALQSYKNTDTGLKTIVGYAKNLELEYKLWETGLESKQHLPLELVQKCRNLKAITF